ncbi:bifunctional hydroxymethylpyrimidine kinase/phosphomethylpyrimidine kinase [Humibacter ginsenosidimutans]|uniref:Bifunctional hydroxymethylpyrimidine kinase/phosphomethylpyrimidine kinase n=1 Tax=Humibacter ginsenosidimutans TaxID=2599293 RepID=A0A5B8M7W1_9MICO|nr:bifunctional hydroxymethylpyrimidine kinase/phosphomethylpyrimidine kinase [Humibacter ginsenosidimutans]QDZ16523.1 bifunctional hydroxymethylpyrimidine kinase/phosphomethylpyrimidine kinase [Humibacter ginsenosidimutans]
MSVPRVLSIAGSDPSGGAGIQADLKAIAANGGYGMAVITALTAQNTTGVTGVHLPPAEFVRQQLDVVADDIQIDAVKIGMLAATATIEKVAHWLDDRRPANVVLDPVMVSTTGSRLLDAGAEHALRDLLHRADLITPNLPELAVLCGEPLATIWTDALKQGERLAAAHGVLVLVKGGHLSGDRSPDALVAPDGSVIEFDAERVETTATHGTGCSLSSAVATRYAATGDWATAVAESKAWLTRALRGGEALRVGRGQGPIDHFAGLRRDIPVDHTQAWWNAIAPVREGIDELPFVRGLADGSLDERVFRHYLEQDALYLREYARVLAKASALAPTRAEQVFWASAAQDCITGEAQLHDAWLGGEPDVEPSAVNRAYLAHLAAAGPDYGTIVAAALPCFWLYLDVGERLAEHSHNEHPYRDWLATYSDPGFAQATADAISWARIAAANANDEQLLRMATAFRVSAEHELAFFAQTP